MSKAERHERYGWWLNELESLGVDTTEKNGLSNEKEASDLVETVKRTLYEDYLQTKSENKWACKGTSSYSALCIDVTVVLAAIIPDVVSLITTSTKVIQTKCACADVIPIANLQLQKRRRRATDLDSCT
jgi:hypothetical protein